MLLEKAWQNGVQSATGRDFVNLEPRVNILV